MAAKAFGPPTSTPTASAGAGPSNAAATGAGASGRPGTPAPVQVASAPSPGAAAAPGVGGGGSTTHASQPQQPPTTMPAYDPTSALASINHKIALLEEQTQGFVEINARTADEARRRVRGVPTEELEGQYIDLFQEMKRQERNHLKERSRLHREKTELEGTLARTTASRTKIEARTRDLALELKRLMDENRRLTSLFESARGEIEAIKEEFEAVRSEPALALGRLRLKGPSPGPGSPAAAAIQQSASSNAEGSPARRSPQTSPLVVGDSSNGSGANQPTIGLTVVCKGRREHLHFVLRPNEPLQPLFDSWSSRFPPPLEPPPSALAQTNTSAVFSSVGKRGMANTSKHGPPPADPSQPPIAPQSLGPPFLFTFAGRVLAGTDTPEAVGLEDGDGLVAIEIVDLARDPAAAKASAAGGDDSVVVGNPLTKAAKKNVQAVRAQLEAVFDDVVRERLKLVFRQYETRERQFEAVVRSKDLEILLARARAEQARALAGEAQELSDEVEELSLSLATLRCSQDDLLGKLVSLARAPTPEKAVSLSTLIRDVVARQQAEATTGTTTIEPMPPGPSAAMFLSPPVGSLRPTTPFPRFTNAELEQKLNPRGSMRPTTPFPGQFSKAELEQKLDELEKLDVE